MRYRARFRGRCVNGKYVTTQTFVFADTETEAKKLADDLVPDITKKLSDRENCTVENVRCWKIELNEKKQKRVSVS